MDPSSLISVGDYCWMGVGPLRQPVRITAIGQSSISAVGPSGHKVTAWWMIFTKSEDAKTQFCADYIGYWGENEDAI